MNNFWSYGPKWAGDFLLAPLRVKYLRIPVQRPIPKRPGRLISILAYLVFALVLPWASIHVCAKYAPACAQMPVLNPLRPLREMKQEDRSMIRLMSCRVSKEGFWVTIKSTLNCKVNKNIYSSKWMIKLNNSFLDTLSNPSAFYIVFLAYVLTEKFPT
jgi:hypothetical protein